MSITIWPLSFIRLALLAAAAAFQCSSAAVLCFEKARHLVWCCLRPLADLALNPSGQFLHGNISDTERMSNHNNSKKPTVICSFGQFRGGFVINEGCLGQALTTEREPRTV